MKKNDLRIGYLIRYRNNELRMVMQYYDKIIIGSNDDGYMNFDNYNENMECKSTEDLDIVEVYGYPTSPFDSLKIQTNTRRLLWKRKDKKEMTISEIEKELGYPIKVVKEREDN